MSKAHEIIKKIAKLDPIIGINRDEEKACYFCLAELWYPGDKHEKDCLWLRAVAFIEEVKQ